MAGNSKSKRKSASKPVVTVKPNRLLAAVQRTLPSPQEYLYNKTLTLAQLHIAALDSLNKIIDGTGNFKDWMNVLYRVYIGAVSVERYFKDDPAISEAFNQASKAIMIIKLRTMQTGEFGVLVRELDSITLALALTDQANRNMYANEIASVYDTVDEFFNHLAGHNRERYMDDLVESLAQVNAKLRAYGVADNDVETVEYREAA